MQTNILCGKCGEVIHTNPSDVPMIIDTPAPVVDDLMVNVECAIGQLWLAAQREARAVQPKQAVG